MDNVPTITRTLQQKNAMNKTSSNCLGSILENYQMESVISVSSTYETLEKNIETKLQKKSLKKYIKKSNS